MCAMLQGGKHCFDSVCVCPELVWPSERERERGRPHKRVRLFSSSWRGFRAHETSIMVGARLAVSRGTVQSVQNVARRVVSNGGPKPGTNSTSLESLELGRFAAAALAAASALFWSTREQNQTAKMINQLDEQSCQRGRASSCFARGRRGLVVIRRKLVALARALLRPHP